ncbi:RNA recognition motif domain-containing protein [Pedosphaera parvula]|uniref:RNP-1 like RNA-binding protein n=1 Tax=Pedosphaera parvula (strain Ellin514) TaxID=320771 RepID=B9XLP5_PEDPL|nr:RNA-binding protein [Pedosphaera parvula]EEF59293.1 RNP-1 like RNA-binding protein [Pedosphaera parvula Ellin514]
MNNRLYVESLPATVTESRLQELFSQKGPVIEVKLMVDAATGRPSGRAFVTMATAEVAQSALKSLHGHNLDGRHLVVAEARPVEERTQGLIGHGFEAGIGSHTRVKDRNTRNRPRNNRKRR